MSCSSYFQGLQPCLEPALFVEPRVLRLKLAPQKSNNSPSSPPHSGHSVSSDFGLESKNKINDNVDMGGFSFLQHLAADSITKKEDDNKVYFPPNFKRSPSMLSEKSLEMCTESLGSETGSDGSESSDEMALLSLENVRNYETRERSKLGETRRTIRKTSCFPPPLTSISGSTNFHVRSHREGGRLVMDAVSVSSCQAFFHAERIDGRLRLHLVKDGFPNSNRDQEEEEEEEVMGETLVDEDEDGIWEEENGGGEMGMEKLPRPSRCKENENGGNRLLNWEPFWVAT